MAQLVKNPPANAGDTRDVGSIPGSGRSLGGGHGNPLQYSCLENPHGQRSQAGYSPCGCKELDTIEHRRKRVDVISNKPRHSLPYNGQSMSLRANTGQVHRLVLHILE